MDDSVLIERHARVVVVRIHRPQALNALNSTVLSELVAKMGPLDKDPDVGCFVVTGDDKAFAAGADIKEMQSQSFSEMFECDFFAEWNNFVRLRTPKIAAVAGYALGGGCELALMCDTIFAAENAKFGQPEIKLGVIPGMGGSQRLTKLIGKSKAMDLILSGRMMDAAEAERCGLVSRLFPLADLLPETIKAAQVIAEFGKTATRMAREAVDRALETGLSDGLLFERRIFHSLFATHDQKEGMAAFAQKRRPSFRGA